MNATTTTKVLGAIAVAVAVAGCSAGGDSGAGDGGGDDGGGDGAGDDGVPDEPGDGGGGPSVGQGGAQDFGQFRAILEAGGIPGPETLDDVGFFNEHKIELPDATCGANVCLHGQLGVLGNMISGSNCTIVLLGMNTPLDPEELERPPLNLAVVVDTSSSLAGAPIEYLREGLHRMLDDLQPGDRISLVAFSDTARVLVEAADGADTSALALAIEDLAAEGGTNVYEGLRTGYDLVAAHGEPTRQNRVILLSDGEATVGITSTAKLVNMSAAYNEAGYSLSTIGMGAAFDPNLMRSLAEQGAGAFYYLEDPAAVVEVFEEEVTTFLVPLARDLRIDVDVDAGYSLRAMYGTKQYVLAGNEAWVDIPIVQIAHRTSASDDQNGRRGGGGAIVLELSPRAESDVEEVGIVGRLHMSYESIADGETIVQDVAITSALAPGVVPEGGHFDAVGVEKSFVMLNVFAGFDLASTRALWGDDRGALGVLQPLSESVTAWLASNPDDDIADDLRYIVMFMDNLRARGAEDPPPHQNPPDPWPQD
jgi:Ca-activated chloride channel family protein